MKTEIEPRTLTRRDALRQRRRPCGTRITIPSGVSPHVRLVFEEMGRQRRTYDEVEERSGVLRTTLKAWRHKNRPGIDSLAAVLGVLGWDFVPIPRAKVLPTALVADLEMVAARHGLETSATIQALIAHVARVHAWSPTTAETTEGAPLTAPDLDDMAPLPAKRGMGGTDASAA